MKANRIRSKMHLVVAAALAAAPLAAQATNGDHMLGVNANQWAMAGAIIAAPEDAGTVLTNPAGLAGLKLQEFRSDFGFGLLNPPRKVNGNESDSDLYLMPAGALAFRVSDRLTTGLGVAGLLGMGVDVADALPAAGNQAVVTTRQVMRISPGFAFRQSDALALGASFNINYQSLAMHTAAYTLPQNQVFGFGATFGLTYVANERVRFGASYVTKQSMDEFEWNTTAGRYSARIDLPAQLALGVALQAGPDMLVEADIKRIFFKKVMDSVPLTTPTTPSSLNFGWDNQTVFAVGLRKQVNDKMTLRAGLNYGKSPIEADDVTNNYGSVAVTEKHLTLGFTRNLGAHTSASLSYARAFENKVESPTGANSIQLEQNVLNFQISYQN